MAGGAEYNADVLFTAEAGCEFKAGLEKEKTLRRRGVTDAVLTNGCGRHLYSEPLIRATLPK